MERWGGSKDGTEEARCRTLSVVLKFPQPRLCVCSLSMVLTHPAPSHAVLSKGT